MAITDAERHRLHTKLDEVLGEEDAAVLISHLPPSGWSDVARTRDLDQLGARLDRRIDQLEARLDSRIDLLEARLDGRFAAVDERFATIDERFRAVDERFNTMEARIDASIERALREQTHRFLAFGAGIAAIAGTVQGIVAAVAGG